MSIERIVSNDTMVEARRSMKRGLAQALGSSIGGVAFVIAVSTFDPWLAHAWKFSFVFFALLVSTLWGLRDSRAARLLLDRPETLVAHGIPESTLRSLRSAYGFARVESIGSVVLVPLHDSSGLFSSVVAVLGVTGGEVRCCVTNSDDSAPTECTLFGEVSGRGETLRIEATIGASSTRATIVGSVLKTEAL